MSAFKVSLHEFKTTWNWNESEGNAEDSGENHAVLGRAVRTLWYAEKCNVLKIDNIVSQQHDETPPPISKRFAF